MRRAESARRERGPRRSDRCGRPPPALCGIAALVAVASGAGLLRAAPAGENGGADFEHEAVAIRETGEEIEIEFAGIRRLRLDTRNVIDMGGDMGAGSSGGVVPAPVIELAEGCRIEPVRDWRAYLESRRENGGRWPARGGCRTRTLDLARAEYAGRVNGLRSAGVRLRAGGGEVRWVFEARKDTFRGAVYRGIGWRLETRGLPGALWAYFRDPLPQGGDRWFLAQRWGGFIEERLGRDTTFSLGETQYFAFMQPFLFIAGKDGALLGSFDRPAAARLEIARDGDRLVRSMAIPFGPGPRRATATRYWQVSDERLADRWQRIDAWTAAYDGLAARYRALLDLEASEPRPALIWGIAPPEHYERFLREGRRKGVPEEPWLDRYARESLPRIARHGIRVIYLQSPWHSDAEHPAAERVLPTRHGEEQPKLEALGSGHAPWLLEIDRSIGGEAALARFVEAAHRLGVRVVLWSGPSHLSISSPLLTRHPDRLMWTREGTPVDLGYGDITGVSLESVFFDYLISRYASVFERTRIDGIWLDSFLTFGVAIDFSRPYPRPQLGRVLEVERAIRRAGMREVHIEGVGLLGLSTGGFGYEATDYLGRPHPEEVAHFEAIRGREYGLYRYLADSFLEAKSSYRALASKGVMCVFNLRQLEKLSPGDAAMITRANREYMQVLDRMEHRHLIGSGETWQGVAWTSDRSPDVVLFAFASFEHPLDGSRRIEDLTAGRTFAASGRFTTQPWHTYVVHPPGR